MLCSCPLWVSACCTHWLSTCKSCISYRQAAHLQGSSSSSRTGYRATKVQQHTKNRQTWQHERVKGAVVNRQPQVDVVSVKSKLQSPARYDIALCKLTSMMPSYLSSSSSVPSCLLLLHIPTSRVPHGHVCQHAAGVEPTKKLRVNIHPGGPLTHSPQAYMAPHDTAQPKTTCSALSDKPGLVTD